MVANIGVAPLAASLSLATRIESSSSVFLATALPSKITMPVDRHDTSAQHVALQQKTASAQAIGRHTKKAW